VTVLFADGLPEIFEALPQKTKRRVALAIDLIAAFPQMYPVRRRGLMRRYRYFVAGRFLFYYSVTSSEIRLTAIIPAAMRQA
jgi:plasmid stabilization system protein ParE